MKRFYMLILAILATGSLSGCGSKPDSGGSDQIPDSYDKYEFKRVTSLDEISGDENDEYCLITRGKTTYEEKTSYYSCAYNTMAEPHCWMPYAIPYDGNGNITGDVGEIFHITTNNKEESKYVLYSIYHGSKNYVSVGGEKIGTIEAKGDISADAIWTISFSDSSISFTNNSIERPLYLYYNTSGRHLMNQWPGLWYSATEGISIDLYKRTKITYSNVYDIFPWANDVSTENVVEVRKKYGTYGGPVNKFYDIEYSTDSNDILLMCGLFDLAVVKVDEYVPYKEGSFSEYTYFTNDTSYTLRVEKNMYILTDNGVYMLTKNAFMGNFANPSTRAYSFLTKQERIAVDGMLSAGTTSCFIDYFDQIEFIEWGDESMNSDDAKYVINDPSAFDSSSIYIYEANRFSYKDVFYRVISEQNFSSLFTN